MMIQGKSECIVCFRFRSNAAKKQPYRDFERFADAQESFNRNDFLSALDLSQVLGIQVSPFRKPFLSQMRPLAISANCITDQLAMTQDRLPLSFVAPHDQ